MVEIWHWQAELIARFLLTATRQADFIRLVLQGEEAFALEAITRDGKMARLVVHGGECPRVEYVDERGLMAGLE